MALNKEDWIRLLICCIQPPYPKPYTAMMESSDSVSEALHRNFLEKMWVREAFPNLLNGIEDQCLSPESFELFKKASKTRSINLS